MTEEARIGYINSLKDAAKAIFENAEDYVGHIEGFVALDITIHIETATDEVKIEDNFPCITSIRTNLIPKEIGKEKDLSDPNYKKGRFKDETLA